MEKRPASGGPWTQITTSAAVYSPVFSPDGNYVYYTN